MLTKLKFKVQKTIAGGARLTYRLGFKPNAISALGAVLGVLSGVAYYLAGAALNDLGMYRAYLSLALLLLFFSGFCDALDGALARLCGEVTVLGGFLDSLLDRYVDSAVLCGLILSGLCDSAWGMIALIGSLLTSYSRARAEASGVSMESIGVVERSERIIIIGLSSLLEMTWPSIGILKVGIIALAISSNITVLQRAIYFYGRTAKSKN